MLYILYGRDHIGKKTVRDFICKKYHLTIIPKYTDDKHKNWVLYNYDNYISKNRYKLPEKMNELEETRKNLNFKTWICDEKDPYLKYLPEQEMKNLVGYTYEITKIYKSDHKMEEYVANYWIRESDIIKSLTDDKRDYLLVCTSGKTIDEIKKMDVKGHGTNIKLILIEGPTIYDDNRTNRTEWQYNPKSPTSRQKNSPKKDDDLPAQYLFYHSQNFLGHIRNSIFRDKQQNIDMVKFSENISPQWEKITQMLPVNPNLFIVRPFKSDSVDYNINDLLEQEFINICQKYDQAKLIQICKLRDEEKSSLSSIFDAMNKALLNAHIVVVDLRNHKLNCYYEYGFAMGLMKAQQKNLNVFCFIGIENKSVNEKNQLQEEMMKKLLDDLNCQEISKPFDTTPFPHSKYICSKIKNENFHDCAKLEFISQTSADCNFEEKIKEIAEELNTRVNYDLLELVKTN